MVIFKNINEQEKLYDDLINKSFKCKSPNDAQYLIDIFKSYKWNDTNFRMLNWALVKNLENQIVNEKNRKKVEIPSSLLEGRDKFIFNHMN
jgi:hypothetical protein